MKLLLTKTFKRSYKKYVRDENTKLKVDKALHLLSTDYTDSSLKSHKLSGKLLGLYACSCGYDCRIVYEITEFKDEKCILLVDIGSHNDVY